MAATLIGLTGIVARAQTDEEVNALLAEALLLPQWETVFTAITGTGYKDNIFLSHFDPTGSPFVTASGELLILRLAPAHTSVNLFANAEARNFFGNGVSHQEFTSFSQALAEREINDTFKVSLAAQYYYQDQILDVAVSETNRQAVAVLGHTLSLKPGGRAVLPGENWFEIETPVTRQLLDKTLDDFWEAGAKVAFGHSYRRESHLAMSYEARWRPYDTDPARTATGEAITNSSRFSFLQEARAIWRHHWDEQKHWRTVLTASGRWNEENGGGYSDFARWFASARIQYRARGWEISTEGRLARYDFRTQTVSATNPAKRNRTEWSAVLDIERELAEKVFWVTKYEYETTMANDPLETYTVNMVSTSLRWDF